jgi:hypothetical protein
MTNEPVFTAGQIWKYNNRPGEEDSAFTVLDVEEYINDVVVHIRIDGITMPLPNGAIANHIKHLPFSATALSSSVTRLIGHTPDLPLFLEGYTQWKNAFDAGKAGYWKMSVQEAVEAVCKIASGVN